MWAMLNMTSLIHKEKKQPYIPKMCQKRTTWIKPRDENKPNKVDEAIHCVSVQHKAIVCKYISYTNKIRIILYAKYPALWLWS